MNFLTSAAVTYTLHRLFDIAGVVGYAIENFQMEESAIYLRFENRNIEFKILSERDREQLLEGTFPASYYSDHTLPFFLTEKNKPFSSFSDDQLVIHADIITPSFLLLSRYEEWKNPKRDRHDRFPFEESFGFKYHCIETPVVDEYAMLLREEISRLIPNIKIQTRNSRVIATHDIDILYRFPSLWKSMKSILADLLKTKSWRLFTLSLKNYRSAIRNPLNDPYIQAIFECCQQEQSHGLTPTIFFKAQHPNETDATYDIEDKVLLDCISQLRKQNIDIGLHGSYLSYNQSDILKKEKDRLHSLTGINVNILRQHYLRCNFPQTLPVWQQNGFTHDYTLEFAEHEGFRCGTCHPYPLYDTDNDCESSIIEHPLIVMDGTLLEYRKLSVEKALQQMQYLHQRCKAVEGDFVVLWHNHTTGRKYTTFFKDCYLKFLQEL